LDVSSQTLEGASIHKGAEQFPKIQQIGKRLVEKTLNVVLTVTTFLVVVAIGDGGGVECWRKNHVDYW